ncbi:Cytochrome c [Roseovarius litorisediminis]|uniref:Cytochrome c n=1 Tax=Roseovarius litorisediminis TaxID=1312363 RepID=A0A1Y5TNY6_9RHOB|nr:c-type cytochrome [Roseovarius litorisediminis]SLN68425.1 Cytochrome c [Roseovarius litorisediminis]
MSTCKLPIIACSAVFGTAAFAEGPDLGEPLSADEIPFYATYVMPDGRGLPDGSGTAAEGAEIYAQQCTSCHGETGTEGPVMPPVWPNEIWPKSVGKHWPYATTLFDYIRRAMPLDAPKSLSDDEAYALAAFILAQNGLIDEDTAMTAETLPTVEMPNRDNFIDVWATQGEKPW